MKKIITVGDFKIGKEEKKAISEVLVSGRLSEGLKTAEFERMWAEFIETRYCIATSSGSGALITALTALKYLYNLPSGTKVITSPLTYIADASSISAVSFEPVFVDVDPLTFGITPELIENHLKKTKDIKSYGIILPVDLIGYPVQIDKINKIAKKYGLLVVEDAAQAHGSVYQGKKCGSQALISIFSFYIAHNIQAGEMGAIVTNNPLLMKLCKQIKAQGRVCNCLVCTRAKGYCPNLLKFKDKIGDFDPRFTHELIGYNFKTMEFQAALGFTQLKKVKEIIKKRQRNIRYLNQKLNKYKDILQLPLYSEKVSYLSYPLVIKKPKVISRKFLREKLEENGIETRPLFGCIPTQQPAYSFLKNQYRNKLSNAEFIGTNGFYIGCHQYLSLTDLNYIVKVFKKILD
ncbi:DegT/DnrJ/EryC1/StrS family aminotransferase [Patescibacteria group bacterium]|nr:DegT/DnrJ/EryC1/StrS family aminotransferase [Patescibacteria group bacterium]MBU4056740.1 DegT/DnrJ/EryC1/StrS family aminotransferase [Patescibacteria group bacterium]MBU4368433.1 DegT/DnrJ/EryC1/StrS family aminotransferase [Patescibacteria group bacterium]